MNGRINTPVFWTIGICWLAAPAAQGEAPPPLEAADDGLGLDYNRVGDFKMPTSQVVGLEVAIRVTLNRMYMEKNEDTLQCPVRQGLPDLQAFEGQVRYLGPPEAFSNNSWVANWWVGAKLQCAPFVRDWSPAALAADLGISEADAETIYYYGAEVVPCSIHAVQQATQSCVDSASEDCFSDPLQVRTALWGDLWSPFGSVNFTDIGAEVIAFKQIRLGLGGIGIWRAMLRENEGAPGRSINWTDIGKTVDAFKSIPYKEKGPLRPGVEICGDGIDNNCNGAIDEDGARCEGCAAGADCVCSAGFCEPP